MNRELGKDIIRKLEEDDNLAQVLLIAPLTADLTNDLDETGLPYEMRELTDLEDQQTGSAVLPEMRVFWFT